MQDLDEAIEQYRKALQLKPRHRDVKDRLQRCQSERLRSRALTYET